MIKNLISFYCLFVMLISIIVLIIPFSILVGEVVAISFPQYKYAHKLEIYSDNELYAEHLSNMHNVPINFSEEVLTTKRLKALERYKETKKNESIASLISTLPWIICTGLMWLLHWFAYRRNKKSA